MRNLRKIHKGFFLLPVTHLEKESPQDNGGAVYKAKRILPIYVEPGGLCAMTSNINNKYRHHLWIQVQFIILERATTTTPQCKRGSLRAMKHELLLIGTPVQP